MPFLHAEGSIWSLHRDYVQAGECLGFEISENIAADKNKIII